MLILLNKMKIIITEEQYKLLNEVNMTEDNLRRFLYSIWDRQKKQGEEPFLDDVIYDVTEVQRGTYEDVNTILPIWFEYIGGFDNIYDEIKNEIKGQELTIKSSDHNLTMNVIVEDLEQLNDTFTVEIFLNIIDGMVDGYGFDDDGNETMVRMSLRDQYGELEYDVDDFLYFLKEKAYDYFKNKFGKYGITFYIVIDF